jgi:hypothetical protein
MNSVAKPPVAPPPPKSPPSPRLVADLLSALERRKKEAGVFPGVPFN